VLAQRVVAHDALRVVAPAGPHGPAVHAAARVRTEAVAERL
jgi:hypothetical protein